MKQRTDNSTGALKAGYMHDGLNKAGRERVPMGVELPRANMDFERAKGSINDSSTIGPRCA